jgi:hypothetical protein
MGLPQFPLRLLLPVIRAIAVSAECNRDTVYEALKVLERAGVAPTPRAGKRSQGNPGRAVPGVPAWFMRITCDR